MRLLLATVLAVMLSGSAFAECYPPPGLAIQQWYGLCGGTLQQAYAQGLGQGMPYDSFVGMVYQRYASTWAAPQMQTQMPQQPMMGLQTCPLGARQCFNGWARSCQSVGNGTMWITGAQRC